MMEAILTVDGVDYPVPDGVEAIAPISGKKCPTCGKVWPHIHLFLWAGIGGDE